MRIPLALCTLLALGCLAAVDQSSPDTSLRLLAQSLEKCGKWSELGSCLQVKAVGLLDRALRTGPIELTDYLSLVPEPGASRLAKEAPLTEEQILESLPKESEAKDTALEGMVNDRLARFLESRTFKFNMPTEVVQEGRKKQKKGGGGLILAAMFAAYVHKALAVIGVIAGKALLIGKIALMISVLIGLKKLASSDHKETHSVVYADDHHHHHRRSLPIAHELAYSAQARGKF